MSKTFPLRFNIMSQWTVLSTRRLLFHSAGTIDIQLLVLV